MILGIDLDAAVYNNLILKVTKTAGIRNTNYILQCMLKDGYTPSPPSCLALIKFGY